MLTAKQDLGCYGSINAYRHAANERFGMARSLGLLLQLLEEEAKGLALTPRAGLNRAAVISPNTPPR